MRIVDELAAGSWSTGEVGVPVSRLDVFLDEKKEKKDAIALDVSFVSNSSEIGRPTSVIVETAGSGILSPAP